MTFNEFHNGLRVLLNIDRDEFEALVDGDLTADYRRFSNNPYGWFIRVPDKHAMAIYAEIERRNTRNG